MKTPQGKNRYCGPFAIAALTGGTTDDASRLVRSFTGRRAIKYMYTDELKEALIRRGKKLKHISFPKGCRPTLSQWIAKHAKPDTSYVVLVTGHYVVVSNNRFACSQNPTLVKLDDAPGKRRRVIMHLELLD